MIVDLAVFAGFLLVALRSRRFWPLWVAGLQLTTIIRPPPQAARYQLVSARLWRRARILGYPIVLILAVGTWRSISGGERGGRDCACA